MRTQSVCRPTRSSTRQPRPRTGVSITSTATPSRSSTSPPRTARDTRTGSRKTFGIHLRIIMEAPAPVTPKTTPDSQTASAPAPAQPLPTHPSQRRARPHHVAPRMSKQRAKPPSPARLYRHTPAPCHALAAPFTGPGKNRTPDGSATACSPTSVSGYCWTGCSPPGSYPPELQ